MFNLHLTPEQIEFRDTVRSFVKNEISPAVADPKRLEPFAKPLLKECLDKASELGLRTLTLSDELGGVGADTMTSCIIFEELAKGDVDLATVISQTAFTGSLLFNEWAVQAQRDKFLTNFIEDNDFHLGYAGPVLAGSNSWHYHGSVSEEPTISLTATKQGDEWLIDGSVPYASNAPIAKLLIVVAETKAEPSDPSDVGVFLVPSDTAGLKVDLSEASHEGKEIHWHHGCGAKVEFNSCKVPSELLLGGQNKFSIISEAYGKLVILHNAANNLGLGRAAFEGAVEYAKIRHQGGRNIIEHQAIGKKIADMALKLELASTMIYKAAWVVDHPDVVADGSVSDLPHTLIASVYTAEAMHEVTLIAAECFGAMGVMRDMPAQKFVNDGFKFAHSNLNDISSILPIAEKVVNYERPNVA